MPKTYWIASVGLLLAALFAASRTSATSEAPAAGRFVVHEWGTFTSFSGSDGIRLEFSPLADSDLPPFVLNRPLQAGLANLFNKSSLRGLERMETPVTYFYTDRPRQAKVRVAFPQGLLTEFYPPVERMEPAFDPGRRTPLGRSALDWGRVWLVPDEGRTSSTAAPRSGAAPSRQDVAGLVPPAGESDHYAFARETDSALVHVQRAADRRHPLRPQGSFGEKFLFYRGLGNFAQPLRLSATTDGQFELDNIGALAVRSLFLVRVDGPELRFAQYPEIAHRRATVAYFARGGGIGRRAQRRRCRGARVRRVVRKRSPGDGSHLAQLVVWRVGDAVVLLFAVGFHRGHSAADDRAPAAAGRARDGWPDGVPGAGRRRARARAGGSKRQSRARFWQAAAESGEAEPYVLPPQIVDLGRLAEPALARVQTIARDEALREEAGLLLAQFRQFRAVPPHAESAAP